MFYLIFCSLVLTIEVICLIFYFCPIATCFNYNGDEYRESIIDFLFDGAPSVLSLAFTVVSITFAVILLVKSIKMFCGKKEGTMFSFVFGLVFIVILSVQLILFITFKKSIYNIYEHGTILMITVPGRLCNAILILFILALILSALMLFISAVYNFSTELRKSIFFSMRSKKCSESKFGQDELAVNDEKLSQKNNSNIDLLLRYNELRNQGIISEEEFAEKKKELL